MRRPRRLPYPVWVLTEGVTYLREGPFQSFFFKDLIHEKGQDRCAGNRSPT